MFLIGVGHVMNVYISDKFLNALALGGQAALGASIRHGYLDRLQIPPSRCHVRGTCDQCWNAGLWLLSTTMG